MNYKVISVESRKGGVGKTTAALNLARMLLDYNYNILLIDADITGTNITDGLESPFWSSRARGIRYEKEYANLIDIFHRLYLKGEDLPTWTTDLNSNNEKEFKIIENSINVLGSQLYKSGGNGIKEDLICNPSILFDSIHIYWFIEFLQQISNSFQTACGNDKAIIIIDNSPGYVGISPAIQDWLTDLGPLRGKFLTVSSVDIQDLNACVKSISHINTLFLDKIRGAKAYSSNKSNNDHISEELNENSKNFYINLLTKDSKNQSLDFYTKEITKKNYDYKGLSSLTQAIVLNRAPLELKSDDIRFDLQDVIGGKSSPLYLEGILSPKSFRNKNLIYYDEYIDLQFKRLQFSSLPNNRKSNTFLSLNQAFIRFEKYLKENQQRFTEESNYDQIRILNKKIKSCKTRLDFLISKISKELSLLRIKNFIKINWRPEYLIDSLMETFEVAYQNQYYYDEYVDDSYENPSEVNEDKSIESFLNEIIVSYRSNNPSNYSQTNLYSFKALAYILTSHRSFKKEQIPFYKTLHESIVRIQAMRYKEWDSINDPSEPFREFLVNEFPYTTDLTKYLNEFTFSGDSINRLNEDLLTKYYHQFCKSQIRILDFDSDMELLIGALNGIVFSSNEVEGDEVLFPYYRDILDNMIVRKDQPYIRSLGQLQKGLKSANYMTEFQRIIELVTKKWQLGK